MIYALRSRNGKNERIHILNAIKGKVYFCEYCGDRLIPHQGRVMPWHYKHKENPNCTIGDRSGRGCIINTNNNNGYCGGSIECDQECTLRRSLGVYVLNGIKESLCYRISSIQNNLSAMWRKRNKILKF